MHYPSAASAKVASWSMFCVVCMRWTVSDGRERVHVFIVCHVRVDGTVGDGHSRVVQDLVFAIWVYPDLAGKGLSLPFAFLDWRDQRYRTVVR